MKVIILSCSTGGGHNAAAKALEQEFQKLDVQASVLDPYTLHSARTAENVGKAYTSLVDFSPELFGAVYTLGEDFTHLMENFHFHSPVYSLQKHAALRLQYYLEQEKPDAILTTHPFPAEMLTRLKSEGILLPLTMYVNTDYTCIPLLCETDLDWYIIASEDLKLEFIKNGFAENKLLPYGIPICPDITQQKSRRQACITLGLDPQKQYILVSGGSFGAMKADDILAGAHDFLKTHPDFVLLVLCSHNDELKKELKEKAKEGIPVLPISYTSQMADYLKASSLFIGKPGGLSSTEVCVAQVPFIIANPIPGCETENTAFFTDHHMALYARNLIQDLSPLMEQALQAADEMEKAQQHWIHGNAARTICQFVIDHAKREEETC